MSASNKIPEGLKDSKCKKGNLGVCPPIPYVPPMDLLQTKENMDTLKLKLPYGTVFSMMIFANGNPEDYLQYLIAVLHLINQKNEKLKAKVKATTACCDGKGKPKKGTSGGGSSVTTTKKVSLSVQVQPSPQTERSYTRSLGALRA